MAVRRGSGSEEGWQWCRRPRESPTTEGWRGSEKVREIERDKRSTEREEIISERRGREDKVWCEIFELVEREGRGTIFTCGPLNHPYAKIDFLHVAF